ncbi:MAG: tetratricopeptide repeat protein [Terrimicrobiaceae bacterium]
MKFPFTRILCLLVGLAAFFPHSQSRADETSDLFLRAYQQYQAAEKLEGEADPRRALIRYREAESLLSEIASSSPDWQPLVVEYRLKRTRESIAKMETQAAGLPPLEEELEGPLPSSPERAQPATSRNTTPDLPPVTTTPGARQARPAPATTIPSTSTDSPTLANALRELVAAKKELTTLRTDNKKLNDRLEKATADLKSARVEVDRTKVNVVELKSQLAQANDAIENFRRDGGSLSDVRAEREKEMSLFLRKLAEADADAEVLREENAALMAKLERASGIITESEKIRVSLLEERKTLATSQNASAEDVAAAQKKLAEAESQIQEAKAQVAEAESKLKEKTEEQKLALQQEQEKARAAAEELTKLAEANADLATQLAAAKESGATKKEVDRLTAENSAMAAKLAEAEKKLTQEGRDIAITALQSELNGVNDRLLEAQAQLASRDKRLEDLAGELDQTSAELARLRLLPEPTSDEKNLLAENDLLRGIILRQIKLQNQRDEALRNLEGELDHLKIKSENLNVQLAILGSPVLELNPEERALFKDPVALLTDPQTDKLEVSMAITKPTAEEATANLKETTAQGAADLTEEARAQVKEAQEFFNQKSYVEAEKVYLKIAQSLPDNYFVLSNLGAVQIEAGKPAAAEVALAKAISISPQDSFAQTHLGIAFSRQGRFDEAQAALTKAIELNPSDAIAYNYLGVCLAQKGDQENSEANLKKAIEINGEYANAHFNLAVLYATGKPPSLELAKEHYQLATKFGAAPDPSLEQLIQ